MRASIRTPAAARETRRARGRRVRGFRRPLGLLLRERRLVHEHVRLARDLEHRAGRGGVPREDDLAPGPRRAEHLLRRDLGAVGEGHTPRRPAGARTAGPRARRALAAASTSKRPGRGISTSAYPFDAGRVGDLEHHDPVVAAVEGVARAAARRARAGSVSFPKMRWSAPNRSREPWRPVDRERDLAPAQGERLQHPRQTEVVVRVEVRDEHLRQLDEADRRAQKLPLRALAAVEEDPLAATAQQRAGRPRRAVGTEPDVPRKTRSRSTRAVYGPDIQLFGAASPRARARWLAGKCGAVGGVRDRA